MSKTYSIHIRVDKSQKQVIENNAKASGYKNISDYMRVRSLCFFVCEEKLNKICKMLIPEEIKKFKTNGINRKLKEYIQ